MEKTKNILISQPKTGNHIIYGELEKKFGVNIDFHPFFSIEQISSKEFRTQRINVLDYTALVFSSRHAIDAFFNICAEMRIKVPESMKYFCTTEAIAMYLQKHIVYRKRKIFFGDGTQASIMSLIGTKHAGEKFLITTSASSKSDTLTSLFESKGLDFKKGVFVRNVSTDLSGIDLSGYDLIVLYNPSDLKSLYENFPEFNQGSIKFITFGKGIVEAMDNAGLTIEIKAPTAGAPSAAKAIEMYLENEKQGLQ
ncbi:MAG: uroporphyrinogen-III synthase [Bacteroidales bacterium]|nr:uroporphyrinogen-III synthase [Bacteroidales bacterium]